MKHFQLPNRLLKDAQKEMLESIVAKHDPNLLIILNTLGSKPLRVSQRLELQSLVMDEFLHVGINLDDEPNEVGIQLENLIDILNHL